MLVCALCVLPVFYVPYANKTNMWEVVAVLSLAPWRHTRAVSANLFTTTSDMFPRAAVGSVVGIGGGYGRWRNRADAEVGGSNSDSGRAATSILFMISGSMYVMALAVIHLFSPRLEQAKLD